MKINIQADEGGVIRSWTSFPLKEGEPVFEIKNPYRIRIGFDKVVDGKIVHDEAGYKAALENQVKRVRIQFLKSELAKSEANCPPRSGRRPKGSAGNGAMRSTDWRKKPNERNLA